LQEEARTQRAQAQTICKREVLAIEQIEEVNISPHPQSLAQIEGFLSAKVYIEESAIAFFNLPIFNLKPYALTIHPSLSAAQGSSGGRYWLTSHFSLEEIKGINAITNSIYRNPSITINIDTGEG
jgi:hypothetical protein